MKILHIALIVLTSVLLCGLASLYFLGNISLEQMLLITAVMNGMGIICFSIVKLQSPEHVTKQHSPEDQITETPAPVEQVQEATMSAEPTVEQKWSKAMYKAYSERWNEVFDNIKHPIEESSISEINVLSWDIASKTMDYLLVENDDPNVLERNRNSVNAVVSGKKLSDLELKEYFDDPSTVPAKVIGVHDVLSSQLTKEQKFSTQVFGYLVELSSKDE